MAILAMWAGALPVYIKESLNTSPSGEITPSRKIPFLPTPYIFHNHSFDPPLKADLLEVESNFDFLNTKKYFRILQS
jgi:hypothetical protein